MDERKSTLAIMLDGIAEVPADYPFPRTTLARLLEIVMERARIELDDPRTIDMGERLLDKAREQAEVEQFQ